MSLRSELLFSEDVYVLRARPRHPHVLVNVGCRTIAIVNCVNDAILRTIKLPQEAGEFSIEAWLVSSDGDHSYIFDREEGGFAFQIDHESGGARRLAVPEDLASPVGLCWFAPGLHLIDGSRQAWALENDRFTRLAPEVVEAATRPLRDRITDLDDLSVTRMSQSGQGAYLYGNEVVGWASINATEVQLVENDGSAIGVARLDGGLFVAFEERIVLHEGEGESIFLSHGPDERFVAIEAVEHAGAGYLVVVAGALDGSRSTLRIFGAS
jgi:hypothetical protein